MHKPESVLENATKILLNFEIQMDHMISARKPSQVLVDIKTKKQTNKRTSQLVDFADPPSNWVKVNRNKKIQEISGLCQRVFEIVIVKMLVKSIIIGTLGTTLKNLEKR